ncbi:MAG: zf-HC2 domain-containing protein [Candidatus Dadabacteria bacterium]|nr:zf-HC2 domain-containing protein [Candidatus Dadabacteria bacterium]
MECEKVKELVFEYSEGDLDQGEKLKVERHLMECSDCNLYFEKSHKMWNLLSKFDTVETKDDFVARFWDRVSKEDRKKAGIFDFFGNLRVNLVAGLAGVIILVLGILLANTFVSRQHSIVFTEEDRADEELIIEFDSAVSRETDELLDVYGAWDVPEPPSNDEKIDENKGG